jgi:predicted dehydrogenase
MATAAFAHRVLPVHQSHEAPLRVGLIGCGGRGTGAAAQALSTAGPVELVAMADLFAERLQGSLRSLRDPEQGVHERVRVDPEHIFTGFDAAEKLIASDVDVVLLATPPHFRAQHFASAVAAGKHVFLEKPVAVDGHGVRMALAAAELARQKKLSVVCGLQRHYQNGYRATMQRIKDGAIGELTAARCAWNTGFLWHKERKADWSDMEWQVRNWLYFTWLSGDHIVEQHVHNIDVINWAKGGHPVKACGMGGRQVRTDPKFGNIFDHHAVRFEYADGMWMFSECRQIEGCQNDVSEHLVGTRGRAHMDSERWTIEGQESWTHQGPNNNPYQTEHDELFASIREGRALNDGVMVAESTLTAIMGRMATYSGREVTWQEALESPLHPSTPASYVFGPLANYPVAVPGAKA